jgi:cysteine-S-conjugate beta-lyase
MKLETLLANPCSSHGDISTPFGSTHFPIFQTATFDLKKQKGEKKYDYSRSGNPTRESLEKIFAKAENGHSCLCTNTGIAAISLLLDVTLVADDFVLVEKDCYGGTYRLLKMLRDQKRINTIYADFNNLEELKTLLSEYTFKLILCESPTNPGLKIIDLEKIAALAKSHGALFAVDNSLVTFASQRPLDFGADFSVFSTTKFVSGHGSVIAGAIVTKEAYWTQKVRFVANATGKAQSPIDVFLLSLGLPTLIYRMKAQEQSALQIATYLRSRNDVPIVKFTGFDDHPDRDLIRKQMKINPAVITLDMNSPETARKFVNNTKLFGEKASFGAADSRIEIPSEISHASYSEADLKAIGLSKSSVRLSIGLENTEDLLDDIAQALS